MKRKRKTPANKNGKKLKKKFHKKRRTDNQTKTEVAHHDSLISSNWEKLSKVVGYDPHSKKSNDVRTFRKKNKMGKKADSSNTSLRKNPAVPGASNTPSVNPDDTKSPEVVVSLQNQEHEPQKMNDSVLQSEGHVHESKLLTRAVAMDCEMVGTGPGGTDSMLARVSIVNSVGQCVYDKYVYPKIKVTDYRTAISGVRPKDLKTGEKFETVQKEVAEILKGRMLVGHALRNDFKVLYFNHPKRWIRDTATYKPFQKICGTRLPSLKKLASVLLNATIQTGEHNSIEDARTAMQIYCMYKKEWEMHEKKRRNRSVEPKSD